MAPWERRAVASTLPYLRLLQTGVGVMLWTTKLKICHATSFSTPTVTDFVFSEPNTAGRCLESHRADGQRDEDGKLKNNNINSCKERWRWVTFSLLLPLKLTNSNKQNYKVDKEPDRIPSVPLRSSELSVHVKTSSTVILNVWFYAHIYIHILYKKISLGQLPQGVLLKKSFSFFFN